METMQLWEFLWFRLGFFPDLEFAGANLRSTLYFDGDAVIMWMTSDDAMICLDMANGSTDYRLDLRSLDLFRGQFRQYNFF